MSRPARLVVIPAVLFVAVVVGVFLLAQAHPAKPEASAAGGGPGDRVHGGQLFAERCAGCHGEGGRNGTVGPTLAGNPISLPDARAQIQTGGGVMPANLVQGQDLEDVLAYLETILRS